MRVLRRALHASCSSTLIGDEDIEALRAVGWDEYGIYGATALIGLSNFSGRMEAAADLPGDEIPSDAQFAGAKPD
jgi:hypothetical protein